MGRSQVAPTKGKFARGKEFRMRLKACSGRFFKRIALKTEKLYERATDAAMTLGTPYRPKRNWPLDGPLMIQWQSSVLKNC
jgi:hypothetical protein